MASIDTPAAETPRAPVTLKQMAEAAIAEPRVRADATLALDLFRSHCEQPMPRIPGCDTWLRIAIRIHRGMTVEEAAAAEYRYRWHLFLSAWHNHVRAKSTSRFIHRAMCYPAPRLLEL